MAKATKKSNGLDKLYVLLTRQINQLMAANQRLVEALIANNAVDYAVAQKLINDMNKPASVSQQQAEQKGQSMEENLNDIVDQESQIAASPVEG